MPYALIAGGSKGIGLAIAEALARRKYDLILIGRHPSDLSQSKTRLEFKYQIHVAVINIDLQLENAAIEIAAWCDAHRVPLQVLCNVAGLGGSDDFLSLPADQLRTMVKVNLESAVSLTDALLPRLQDNAPSYILNVGSMAGFAPIPVKNVYSATKSAIIFFSYALRYQLRSKNISVSCLCPGPVFTKPEIKTETISKLGWLGVRMAISPEEVGEIAVRRTLAGQLVIVPGILAKLFSMILRVIPRRVATFVYYRLGK